MAKTTANVRMYRLDELGDCFLLQFTQGRLKSNMLIDCGSFRNGAASKARISAIAKAIKKELGKKALDVIVATHQHNDHVSGFVHAEDTFQSMRPAHIWLSWLDDPKDRLATGIGREHKNLQSNLIQLHDELRKQPRLRETPAMRMLGDVLGFHGVKTAGGPPQLPADGIALLKEINPEGLRYLRPGVSLDLPGLGAGAVKVHVLGPPRDMDLLYRVNPRKGESYDHALAMANLSATHLLDAARKHNGTVGRQEEHYPFAERSKRQPGDAHASEALRTIKALYDRPDQQWRNVDDDWLAQAETLALYLDTYTNNSSLVLALELMDSGKVLLFVGDAQTGNWLSWDKVKWEDDTVRTDDLLRRTVLYKVGHHGSHNATLREALEKMESEELTALIPVHRNDPNIARPRGWKMPAAKLLERLIERTDGRLLRMDDHRETRTDHSRADVKAKWRKANATPKVTPEFVEITISPRP